MCIMTMFMFIVEYNEEKALSLSYVYNDYVYVYCRI